jgi:hypothetical protein
VIGVTDACVTLSCDQECWANGDTHDVVISVFAPDALYRITGHAHASGHHLTCDADAFVERVQRRQWPRKRMDLPVTLCPVEEGARLEGVPGRTVDISVGGLCVETLRPVEGEGDPTVLLRLPDGTVIVAGASTVAVEELDDGWRYRLAFRELDDDDASRLATLVAA